MKLSLKAGEHIRLSHDAKGAALQVYAHRGIVHITALPEGTPGDVTVIVNEDEPSLSLVEERSLAAAEKLHGVGA